MKVAEADGDDIEGKPMSVLKSNLLPGYIFVVQYEFSVLNSFVLIGKVHHVNSWAYNQLYLWITDFCQWSPDIVLNEHRFFFPIYFLVFVRMVGVWNYPLNAFFCLLSFHE